MGTELILAWLGMGVLTVYVLHRATHYPGRDFTLADVLAYSTTAVVWPVFLVFALLFMLDKVVIKKGDRR